ncbi:MAG TPA: pyrroloquinoline quinone biosynthesis peptide chaperone PqqD [Rhodospirillales bacterium]
MSAERAVDEDSVPRFGAHMKLKFDEKRKRWMVLAPERLFLPDDTALEILRRCDGVATVKAIVDDLARKFNAPGDVIMNDVKKLVQDFRDKGVLET